MRVLIDTSILLEVILEQEKANEARDLLSKTEEHDFFLTVFSVHSIGILLFRRTQHDVFRVFLEDTLSKAGTALVRLSVDEMHTVSEAAQRFRLDFDDAYQYVAAEKHGLTIVSFDADFDRTPRGRKTPAQIAKV